MRGGSNWVDLFDDDNYYDGSGEILENKPMKKIFSTSDIAFLNLFKSQLETSGIISLIKNEYPPAAGEVTQIIAEPELWIFDDNDFDEAATILRELLSKSKHSTEKWQCHHCSEWLEGQFDLCWKCGNSKE